MEYFAVKYLFDTDDVGITERSRVNHGNVRCNSMLSEMAKKSNIRDPIIKSFILRGVKLLVRRIELFHF
ncbi:hypothetical protein GOQ27_01250, partial [Clostridium sp. D2Q-11]